MCVCVCVCVCVRVCVKSYLRYIFKHFDQWSNACYFEEQISITATEGLTPYLVIVSARSESLREFLKEEKLADIDLQYEFF